MKKSGIIIILYTILLVGCWDKLIEPENEPDGRLEIINSSNRVIIFGAILKYELNNGDTLLLPNKPIFDDYENPNYLVNSNSSNIDEFSVRSMKIILDKDIEMYYLFDIDTLKKYNWSEIAKGYKVLKRVDFDTWEDLEKCNFTISYP